LTTLFVVARGLYLPISRWAVALLIWIILRDLVAIAYYHDAFDGSSLRYSIQMYLIYTCLIVAASYLAGQFRSGETAARIGLTVVATLVIICLPISLYQFFAYKIGLPINGVTTVSGDVTGSGLKFAAYSVGGVSVFRPYALFVEPKHMAAVFNVCLAFVLILWNAGWINKRMFTFLLSSIILTILLTASTSGFVALFVIIFTYLLLSQAQISKKLAGLLLLCILAGVILYFTDWQSYYEVRIQKRLFSEDAEMEFHIQEYTGAWFSGLMPIIIGLGYIYFDIFSSQIGTILRLVPNIAIVWWGVSGGIVAIILLCMAIVRDRRYLRNIVLFLPVALTYTTNPSFFLLFFFSSLAVTILKDNSLPKKASTIQDSTNPAYSSRL